MAQDYLATDKRHFKHLTACDHGKIAVLRAERKSMQTITDAVSCHKSTVSRELKRDTVTR